MASCCKQIGKNTGTDCTPLARRAKQIILVPTFDADGNKNFIDLTTATLDETYFDAQSNNADTSKRWYPLPILEDINITRGDSYTQTFESGRAILLNKGAKAFTGFGLATDGHSPVFPGNSL